VFSNVSGAAVALGIGLAAGSVPFGHIAGLLNRQDIRHLGSGNIGATNVLRTLGLGWAIPVLLLDVGKGALPVLLAARLGVPAALAAGGAVLGHVFTPWLKFRGGKGVATAMGAAGLLCPRAALPALACFLLVVVVTGYVSVSSLTFAVSLPMFTGVLYRANPEILLCTLFLLATIGARHADNIRRLLGGTEPRISLWLRLFGPHE
jgi:glycerol-3-phosphate acyltransferase PlsY